MSYLSMALNLPERHFINKLCHSPLRFPARFLMNRQKTDKIRYDVLSIILRHDDHVPTYAQCVTNKNKQDLSKRGGVTWNHMENSQ